MRTWMWITPFVIILIGASAWIGWTLMTASNNMDTLEEDKGGASVTEERQDMSTEVVNTPVSDSIVVFKDESIIYRSGHDFIRSMHNFYNDTLCWGRIETATYSPQKEQAEEVIFVIQNTEVKEEDLKSDFNSILSLAKTVSEADNREAMRKLHRYFHDLDIYFNGYSHKDTFQVTEFKGE